MPGNQKTHIEFMKQEYTGICQAFGDLYNVILKVFNFYLLLAAVPFTVAAIIYKSPGPEFDLSSLPLPMSVLFMVVSILGFLITLSMIHLRMEQILYARTVNCIRRYFCESDTSVQNQIDDYLNLPTTDELPPFLEFGRFFFWQIILIGIIDSLYGIVAFINLTGHYLYPSIIVFILFFSLHPLGYIVAAEDRDRNYRVKCPAIQGRIENY